MQQFTLNNHKRDVTVNIAVKVKSVSSMHCNDHQFEFNEGAGGVILKQFLAATAAA